MWGAGRGTVGGKDGHRLPDPVPDAPSNITDTNPVGNCDVAIGGNGDPFMVTIGPNEGINEVTPKFAQTEEAVAEGVVGMEAADAQTQSHPNSQQSDAEHSVVSTGSGTGTDVGSTDVDSTLLPPALSLSPALLLASPSAAAADVDAAVDAADAADADAEAGGI